MQHNLASSPSIDTPVVSPFATLTAANQALAAPSKIFEIRHSISRLLLLALLIFFGSLHSASAGQDQAKPLTTAQHVHSNDVIYFGLLPYLSTAALIKTWRPLADYIAETLHKKVIIKTAPNFKTFLKRTVEGRYDLLMTAPHFAALAIKNNGYHIIAGHSNDLSGDIIVAKNSRFQSINDLRNKTFAIPGQLAAVSMLAELLLQQHGLTPNKDIRIKITTTHNGALISVAEGKADAAVAVGGLYRRLNAGNKYNQLRRLAKTDTIPHAMYIAKPSFPENDIRKLRKALIDPMPGSLGAQALIALKNNFNGGNISNVSPEKFERLALILSSLETKTHQE